MNWRVVAPPRAPSRSKNASGGSLRPAVWPSRSRIVASGSPRHGAYQRSIGSSRLRRPRSTSRIASAAVAILVTLANGNEVCDVIGRRGFSTAAPMAPSQTRPSGKTTAADAPGTPVSSTFSRRSSVSSRATCSVRTGPDDARAPRSRPASSSPPKQPLVSSTNSTRQPQDQRSTWSMTRPASRAIQPKDEVAIARASARGWGWELAAAVLLRRPFIDDGSRKSHGSPTLGSPLLIAGSAPR